MQVHQKHQDKASLLRHMRWNSPLHGIITKTQNRMPTRSLEENLENLGSSLISRRVSRQLIVMRSTGETNSSITR